VRCLRRGRKLDLSNADRPGRRFAWCAIGNWVAMAEQGSIVYHPGQIVPVSGIYGCGEDADGHRYESTDVKGNRFPPMPAGCRGGGWVLDKSASHPHHQH
jgi:hypothetical protein